MDNKTFLIMVDRIHKARVALCTAKGNDYADPNMDTLANFKRMYVLCSTLGIDVKRSSADCAMFLTVLKIDRWCNLRNRGVKPQNESVVDTIEDLHNYIDLGYASELEQ